jgi:hypothetical protein
MGKCSAPLFFCPLGADNPLCVVVALDVGVCQTDQCANLVLLLRCLDMARPRLQTALYSLSTRLSNRLLDNYTRLSSQRS